MWHTYKLEDFKEHKAGIWHIWDQGLNQVGWEFASWLSVSVLLGLLMRRLNTAKIGRNIPVTTSGLNLKAEATFFLFPNLFQMILGIWTVRIRNFLGWPFDKKVIHTSDWHRQLPALLNNLNGEQIELGRISNLRWIRTKSHAQITQAIKQVYPGDQRNGIFLENGKRFEKYISKRRGCSWLAVMALVFTANFCDFFMQTFHFLLKDQIEIAHSHIINTVWFISSPLCY